MTTLFRKAFEYCLECEADVSVMLRVRHTGQIVYFNSDGDGWPLSQVQLVSNISMLGNDSGPNWFRRHAIRCPSRLPGKSWLLNTT